MEKKPFEKQPLVERSQYSFVEPQKIVNVGESKMETKAPPEMKTLTIKSVVSDLIEKDLLAWKHLPQSVRDAMMERPADFQFIKCFLETGTNVDFNILHNGTIWRWKPAIKCWVLEDIVR